MARSAWASTASTSRDRERLTRQALFLARQHQLAGRILLEHVLLGEPGAPTAQRREPMRLARETQPLAIALAVVVDVALKALEHLGRHGRAAA